MTTSTESSAMPARAVMVAPPAASAFSAPVFASTLTTDGSLLDHTSSGPATG